MKKTCTANINGVVFNIDEDAYQLLNNYLESVRKQFDNEKEPSDVMQDIEDRIAELLRDRMSSPYAVITINDVKYVISVMGNPSDFSDDPVQHDTTQQRKLYRNPDDKVLGGVCSGLGVYFNIESWIVRVLFIVFVALGGAGGLIYLILWLVVPEALTSAQKLEMQGKSVTIDNLINSAKDEFNNLKQRIRHR